MQFPLEVEGFEGQRLVVKSGIWTGPKLFVGGQPAPREGKDYVVHDNVGRRLEARLSPRLLGLDPVPKVVIAGHEVTVAPPLAWYAVAWMGLPVILMFIGGAVGGLCAGIGVYLNARIFRSRQHIVVKYVLTGLVSAAMVVVFATIAAFLSPLFVRRAPRPVSR